MIKNYIKLNLTRKNTVRNGMFYNHTKLFELAAPCTCYQTAAQCSISQHAFRAMSILLQYLDLITATDKKPAFRKYNVANGIRIRRALQLTSGNSKRAVIQKEVIESVL